MCIEFTCVTCGDEACTTECEAKESCISTTIIPLSLRTQQHLCETCSDIAKAIDQLEIFVYRHPWKEQGAPDPEEWEINEYDADEDKKKQEGLCAGDWGQMMDSDDEDEEAIWAQGQKSNERVVDWSGSTECGGDASWAADEDKEDSERGCDGAGEFIEHTGHYNDAAIDDLKFLFLEGDDTLQI